ncbi:MAG: hypothetical protein ACXWQO_18705, partial [Bdellovibrionota bacterium]
MLLRLILFMVILLAGGLISTWASALPNCNARINGEFVVTCDSTFASKPKWAVNTSCSSITPYYSLPSHQINASCRSQT